jgi:hypothetical protein
MFRSKRTRWPVVVAGVVLAAILGSLGSVQAQQSAEKNRLGEEIALVEQALNGTQQGQAGSTQEEIENRLSETSLDLGNAKEQLSRSTDSIVANETLFNIAAACGVEVTEVSVSPVSQEDLAEVTCSILPIQVTVSGKIPNLIDFIMTLNTSVANGLVRSARISVQAEMTEEDPFADVRFVIYSYGGE